LNEEEEASMGQSLEAIVVTKQFLTFQQPIVENMNELEVGLFKEQTNPRKKIECHQTKPDEFPSYFQMHITYSGKINLSSLLSFCHVGIQIAVYIWQVCLYTVFSLNVQSCIRQEVGRKDATDLHGK
jgi:hypothetical protein